MEAGADIRVHDNEGLTAVSTSIMSTVGMHIHVHTYTYFCIIYHTHTHTHTHAAALDGVQRTYRAPGQCVREWRVCGRRGTWDYHVMHDIFSAH